MSERREWYYAQYGKSIGPISEIRLKELIQEGLITDQTYVWTDGLKDWVHFSQVRLENEEFVDNEVEEMHFPELPTSDESNQEWFYVQDHQIYGPVSSKYLQDCIQTGSLKATNYIWKVGLSDWIPYNTSELLELPSIPKDEVSWYYAEDGQSIGPINQMTFYTYIQEGIINENTYVWKEGMEDWQLLGEMDKNML